MQKYTIFSNFPELRWYCGTAEQDYRSLLSNRIGVEAVNGFIEKSRMVIGEQTHSALVHVATEADAGAGFSAEKDQIPIVDAVITQQRAIYPVVRTADCTPILIYAADVKAVGAIHSGREGTRKNIVQATINAMIKYFGASVKDMFVLVGPAICAAHYPVDSQTYHAFVESTGVDQLPLNLDIRKVIAQQLHTAGVPYAQVEISSECTYESGLLFSYRRDGSHNRQIATIGVAE